MPMRARLLMAGSLLLAIGCAQKDAAPAHDSATPAPMATAAGVTRAPYGTMPDGKTVEQFTLRNAHGIEVRAITYGAIITVLASSQSIDQLVLEHGWSHQEVEDWLADTLRVLLLTDR